MERWERGELTDQQLLPLRLQNGWYIQRYAPMARIAVPYGEISSTELRMLARIAREYDQPDPALLAQAQATQDALQAAQPGATLPAPPLRYGYGHFTTRTNCQFNWIPLSKAAEVMELLASVSMHGIQTSGNDIRNINADAWEGVAQDSVVDCRPFAEITRQWSSLHPEFSYLPRKFKISYNGAVEDRAATGLVRHWPAGREKCPGGGGLYRQSGRWHGAHPGDWHGGARVFAVEPGAQLHRSHHPGVQRLRSAR